MDELLTALQTTGFDFALYAWDHAPTTDYGVVSLESADDLLADNKHVETGLNCFVDYFTRDATSTPKTTIESALAPYPFRLNSVQFEDHEDQTGYIHYEWRVHIYA